ncbi:hypothetical protein ACM01_16070 [Streptomyces viridochromogenes]|uniref:Uncharacterized protein n=1 Tax=Streptomyces viridochromogenes TaxID=1938 RepID=A0A0J7ZDH2_STRVR|nr:hypothetical protein ACM01_16070 [Streptomyces viridochromogenes]
MQVFAEPAQREGAGLEVVVEVEAVLTSTALAVLAAASKRSTKHARSPSVGSRTWSRRQAASS